MKKVAALVAAVFAIGVAASAAPMIAVDSPIYAVTVQSGSLVSHSFAISNLGDEPLIITSVSTSCGCTTAALAKRELAPGESVNLDATVNTAGFRGTVTRSVLVESNDPVNPTISLQILTTVADTAAPAVEEISASDLRLVFYFLIDVRTAEEYAAGHLFGAMNIPLSEFQTNLAAWLPRLPREVPLILYCLAGIRSLQAATILVEAGLANVLNLAGGIAEWNRIFGVGALHAL